MGIRSGRATALGLRSLEGVNLRTLFEPTAADRLVLRDTCRRWGVPHFRSWSLLLRALTHSSISGVAARRMSLSPTSLSNAQLELLGDRVVALAAAELGSDGMLGNGGFSSCASRIGIGELLRCVTEHRAQQNPLADAYEAVAGCVYLDGGIDAARGFVEKTLFRDADDVRRMNAHLGIYASQLREVVRGRHGDSIGVRVVDIPCASNTKDSDGFGSSQLNSPASPNATPVVKEAIVVLHGKTGSAAMHSPDGVLAIGSGTSRAGAQVDAMQRAFANTDAVAVVGHDPRGMLDLLQRSPETQSIRARQRRATRAITADTLLGCAPSPSAPYDSKHECADWPVVSKHGLARGPGTSCRDEHENTRSRELVTAPSDPVPHDAGAEIESKGLDPPRTRFVPPAQRKLSYGRPDAQRNAARRQLHKAWSQRDVSLLNVDSIAKCLAATSIDHPSAYHNRQRFAQFPGADSPLMCSGTSSYPSIGTDSRSIDPNCSELSDSAHELAPRIVSVALDGVVSLSESAQQVQELPWKSEIGFRLLSLAFADEAYKTRSNDGIEHMNKLIDNALADREKLMVAMTGMPENMREHPLSYKPFGKLMLHVVLGVVCSKMGPHVCLRWVRGGRARLQERNTFATPSEQATDVSLAQLSLRERRRRQGVPVVGVKQAAS